jgi:hypothetical protein
MKGPQTRWRAMIDNAMNRSLDVPVLLLAICRSFRVRAAGGPRVTDSP